MVSSISHAVSISVFVGISLCFAEAMDCAARGMCNGVTKYGDSERCYKPDELVRYWDDCMTYQCARRGFHPEFVLYKYGCMSDGRCRLDGETWYTRDRYGCISNTCKNSGRGPQVNRARVKCNGK